MLKKDIYILGIESSCDETAASVVLNGRNVLSNIISSQINIHEKYGGVVPEIASRNHIYDISSVVDEALNKAGLSFTEIDAVAVTYGPGLVGALLVGLNYAKALAFSIHKPLIGINHIKGHIFANFISNKELEPPFVSLIVSGGHTHLVNVGDYSNFEILGRTRDDAAGECFDKVARAIGLGYPGGPKLEKCALEGDPFKIPFPKARMEESLDFSFSGLKSAVLNYLNKMEMLKEEINIADVAASFQKSVTEVLSEKAVLACKLNKSNKLVLSGGVSCNKALRTEISDNCHKNNIELYMPDFVYCTDNAAMIASCGYYEFISGKTFDLSLNAYPNLELA